MIVTLVLILGVLAVRNGVTNFGGWQDLTLRASEVASYTSKEKNKRM